MIKIPDELIEKLKLFCEEYSLGMITIGYRDDLVVILMGKADIGINDSAVLASHVLLGGVISGGLSNVNEEFLNSHSGEVVQ